MTRVHHIDCGSLEPAPGVRLACHCLVVEDAGGLALVEAGTGLQDVERPAERLGRTLIEMAGFRFDAAKTAVRQLERLGLSSRAVRHVVLTHADVDHVGGLADFPEATVHLAVVELAGVSAGHPRYVPGLFAHGPRWRPRDASGARRWYGLEARPLELGFSAEVLLVPLPGHTKGHCGVAVRCGGTRWLFHVGDADYLRAELETEDHPASALSARLTDGDQARRATLRELRRRRRD